MSWISSSKLLEGVTFIKTLSDPETVLVQKENNYVVRKSLDPSFQIFKEQIFNAMKKIGRHPCAIMPTKCTSFPDGSMFIEEEFADGGSLSSMLEKISPEISQFKIQFTKSVARQLADFIFWRETVYGEPYQMINPDTILFQRNGFVKMKFFNFTTKDLLTDNLYVSEDLSDVWALGAILFSIMTGCNFLPTCQQFKTSEGISLSWKKNSKFDSVSALKFIKTATEDEWNDLIGNCDLSYLIKWCILEKPKPVELLSFMYLAGPGFFQGGQVIPNRPSLTTPWSDIYDSWAVDYTRLSQESPINGICFGIRILSMIERFNSGNQSYQRSHTNLLAINTDGLIEQIKIESKLEKTADILFLEKRHVPVETLSIGLIIKSEISKLLIELLEEQSRIHSEDRSLESDRKWREITKNRLSFSRIALSRSIYFFKNVFN